MTALERQLDLLALLVQAARPVPKREVFEAFADEYRGSPDAAERKLSRDKEELRALGIPLEYLEATDEDEGGYFIDREKLYLPEVAFSTDERAALFSVGAAALTGAFPLRGELARAVAKLGSLHRSEARPRPVMYATAGPPSPFAELVLRAATERRRLRLVYPPEARERLVDPYVALHRRGRLAFVGYCHLREGLRTFWADRLAACALAEPNGSGAEFEVPADFDPTEHLPRYPWQVRSHPPVAVTLRFSPEMEISGPLALGLEGPGPYPVTHLRGLVAQVLALGPGVEIVGPSEARDLVRQMLAPLAARLEG